MKRRIAVLTPLYWPSLGGVQETMRVFSTYLARSGSDVRVFTSQRISTDDPRLFQTARIRHSPTEETRDGVRIFRVDCGGWLDAAGSLAVQLAYRLDRRLWVRLHESFNRRLMRHKELLPRIHTFDPDVILCAPATTAVLRIALEARAKGRAKVLVHASLHFSDDNAHERDEIISLLRNVDAVLCNTAFEKDAMISHGVRPERIHPITVGFDIERIRAIDVSKADKGVVGQLSRSPYILYFGRRQAKKGIEELVEAFRSLRQSHPDVKLVLAGQSTVHFERHVFPLVAGDSRVCLIADADEATKRWLFENARVFSMVSRVDSFGIVYLESWLAGRPVIGADNGQMRDVIADGQDGYLVPANDPAALAERLGRLIQDPALADRMGREGLRKTLRRFEDHAVEKELYAIIQDLL